MQISQKNWMSLTAKGTNVEKFSIWRLSGEEAFMFDEKTVPSESFLVLRFEREIIHTPYLRVVKNSSEKSASC